MTILPFELKFEQHPSLLLAAITHPTSQSGSHIYVILTQILQAANQGFDIVVAPEYSFLPKKGPLNQEELNSLLEILKQSNQNALIIPGTFVWYENDSMYNTCYVVHKRQVIAEYHKIREGGESRIAYIHNLIPCFGSQTCYFEFRGLKIGIEICADFGSLIKAGFSDLDLAFLVSYSNSNADLTFQSLKNGGYVVVNDGDYWNSLEKRVIVYRKGNGPGRIRTPVNRSEAGRTIQTMLQAHCS